MPKPTCLWITDSWDALAPHPKETTLRLMEAAWLQGWPTFWADKAAFSIRSGKPWIHALRLLGVVPGRPKDGFEFAPARLTRIDSFDQVHFRPDPPVTLEYLERVRLLARANTRIFNSPQVLLGQSEKLVPDSLMRFAPPSRITQSTEDLLEFARSHRKLVLKSLHGAQSKEVVLALFGSASQRKDALRAARRLGIDRGPIFAQPYLPAIQEGELRAWFAGGTYLGSLVKMPLDGDFRVRIDQGSPVRAAEPSKGQQKILKACSRYLRTHGVALAAVDLIGQQISDFNVTSPGLLVELESVFMRDFATRAINILAKFKGSKI